MIKVKVPATSANLGPGYDSLGLALQLYNTFTFKRVETDVKIKINDRTQNQQVEIPLKENLLYQAVNRVYQVLNQPLTGLEIVEDIEIPLARGLGSSASAVIGGITGAAAFLGKTLTEQEILDLALEMEGHPDNIAPALLGGLVINVISEKGLIYKKIEPGVDFYTTLVIPDFYLKTDLCRQVLPKKITRADAVFNHSRTALLIAAMITGDFTELKIAMEDRLHQNYRVDLIPGFNQVLSAAYFAGAVGVALSGAGPTIIAFSRNQDENIGRQMVNKFSEYGINSRYILTSYDLKGTIIVNEGNEFIR